MRFGIALQLSLLLAGAVVVAVLAIGGLSAWGLRSGFSDYLRQRDEAQFTRLVTLIEERAAADPSMAWLRHDRRAMQDLMDQLHGRELAPPGNQGPPRPRLRPPPPEQGDARPRPPMQGDRRPPPRHDDHAQDERPPRPPIPQQAQSEDRRPPPRQDDHAQDERPPRAPGPQSEGRRPPPQHDDHAGYERPPRPPHLQGEGRRPPPQHDDHAGYERPPRPPHLQGEGPPSMQEADSSSRPRRDAPPRSELAAPNRPPAPERARPSDGPQGQVMPERPPRPGYARPDPPPPRQGHPPPRPPPGSPVEPNPAGTLFERVVIRDAQGRWLAGRMQPEGVARSVRAVKVGGVQVATAEMLIEAHPNDLDTRFLQQQYTGLLLGALATIGFALLAAWGVARRWSRPLQALQRASRQIAQGERMPALQPAGAREIAQLTEDMNAMAQSLTRLEQARRLWIAQISHELRTPLAVLRGELESIEDGARAPTPAVIASLRDEVMQLTRLVGDLHMLSMADMDGLRCDFEPGDAHAMLLKTLQRFEEPARQRGLQLQLPVSGGAPLQVCWDFNRIDQMLSNLLNNSMRYTDAPGVVSVHWALDSPGSSALGDAGSLSLIVEDSAPGVAPEDLSQLFEPLFRADKARQRGSDHGSGLGLSIVRAIVSAHHGQVTAEPSPLGGLRLCVQLPLRADVPNSPHRGSAA